MSIETFAARVFRVLSILLFIVAFFLTYLGLPDLVAVHFAPTGQADGFLGRESIFYLVGGLMVGFNVLFSILAQRVQNLPDAALGVLGTVRWQSYPAALRLTLRSWLYLGVAALNVFLTLCLNALSELNDAQTNETVFEYRWLLTLGAALLLAWLLYLPLRLGLTKPTE